MSSGNSSPRARTGVWVGTPHELEVWRERIHARRPTGNHRLMDFFIRLEALSADREDGTDRAPVTIADVARSLEISRNIFDEGVVFSSYQALLDALDSHAGDEPRAERPIVRLYQQARMATFLSYRDGFITALDAIPFTAESALHGYLRVVLDWARFWPGLTVSTASERTAAAHQYEPAMRRGRHRERFLRATRMSLPLIVQDDVRCLLTSADLEASDVGSTQSRAIGEAAAVSALMDQVRVAVSFIVEDSTLTSLTATNIVRSQVNEALGGALLRMRLRPRDGAILESRVVEEIRQWLMKPRDAMVAEGRASLGLAELEAQFALIGVVRRVFEEGGVDV